jgi:ATP-dependent DNA helicase RecG
MSDSTLKSIDQELFNNFVGRMREKQKEVFKDLSLKDAIIKLDLADNKKLKNAGKIIFSKDAKIPMSIASFVGIDKEGIKNTRKKSGNLYEILNACEEYLFNNTNYFTIMTGKVVGGRKEFPELPLTATREAIINSLVHRDYKSEESNSLYIYKDRIEIYNPGAFNTKFLPEDYIKGTARPLCRNNLIASTIYKVEDTENIGSGIKRIYDECKKMKIKVDFNKEKGGFSVVF